MKVTSIDKEGYARALKAEHALHGLERLVAALGSLVRPEDRLCYGCAWDMIVKPLLSPLVGWGRERLSWTCPEDEEWMRSSDAYNAVMHILVRKLYVIDPANGCGIGRPASGQQNHSERDEQLRTTVSNGDEAPCVCGARAIYVARLDRFIHYDGSDSRQCWFDLVKMPAPPADAAIDREDSRR